MIRDMDQLISTDQTSFFKGRFIEEIIRHSIGAYDLYKTKTHTRTSYVN